MTKNNGLKSTVSSKSSYYNEFSHVIITENNWRLMFLKVCGLDSPTNHLISTAFNSLVLACLLHLPLLSLPVSKLEVFDLFQCAFL